jgi:uncharacterized membrane protein
MTSAHRRPYVDWARAIAVLLMIEAHTTDAWTRLGVRRSVAFRDATILGGFAAPLFLWLAGVAVVLAATRSFERTGNRADAAEMVCRRGLEIFILAFLFRLQGFLITPGSAPVTLFRVDILNIMGPSIVVAGLVWGVARTTVARVVSYAALAAAFTMLTPIVRTTSAVGALPIWLQWYVRPAGDLTMFTLFPWAGFVFAGGAAGALIAAAREDRSERRLQAILCVAGAVLVAFGFYAAGRPSIYRTASFWTSSPTWFAIRLGILMVALAAIYACEALLAALKGRATTEVARGFSPAIDPLARVGRSSLFVYWIHVELVYGYTTWPIHGRLPLWGTVLAYCVFCALMYGAIVLRDRVVETWRTRHVGPTARTATA